MLISLIRKQRGGPPRPASTSLARTRTAVLVSMEWNPTQVSALEREMTKAHCSSTLNLAAACRGVQRNRDDNNRREELAPSGGLLLLFDKNSRWGNSCNGPWLSKGEGGAERKESAPCPAISSNCFVASLRGRCARGVGEGGPPACCSALGFFLVTRMEGMRPELTGEATSSSLREILSISSASCKGQPREDEQNGSKIVTHIWGLDQKKKPVQAPQISRLPPAGK